MKTFPVTVTIEFLIEARSEEVAMERAEAVIDAFFTGDKPKRLPRWWPDLEAPAVSLGEGE